MRRGWLRSSASEYTSYQTSADTVRTGWASGAVASWGVADVEAGNEGGGVDGVEGRLTALGCDVAILDAGVRGWGVKGMDGIGAAARR